MKVAIGNNNYRKCILYSLQYILSCNIVEKAHFTIVSHIHRRNIRTAMCARERTRGWDKREGERGRSKNTYLVHDECSDTHHGATTSQRARPSKQSYNAASRSHYAKMQSPDNRSRAIAGLNLTYLYSRRGTETKWE